MSTFIALLDLTKQRLVRRRHAEEDGLARLEGFLSQGRLAEAELALKILHNLDQTSPELATFRGRIDELRRRS